MLAARSRMGPRRSVSRPNPTGGGSEMHTRSLIAPVPGLVLIGCLVAGCAPQGDRLLAPSIPRDAMAARGRVEPPASTPLRLDVHVWRDFLPGTPGAGGRRKA